MFSKEIRKRALEIYSTTGSVSQTIQQMRNRFSRQPVYQWIRKKDSLALPRKKKVIINSESHRAIPSAEFKLKIIKRCFEKGEMVKDVAKEIGYRRQTIYYWHKEYMRRGAVRLFHYVSQVNAPSKSDLTHEFRADINFSPSTLYASYGDALNKNSLCLTKKGLRNRACVK